MRATDPRHELRGMRDLRELGRIIHAVPDARQRAALLKRYHAHFRELAATSPPPACNDPDQAAWLLLEAAMAFGRPEINSARG